MKNSEKFISIGERQEALYNFCMKQRRKYGGTESCSFCPANGVGEHDDCSLNWLELEAEDEKPLPCPFCGKECNVIDSHTPIGFRYRIGCIQCAYSSKQYKTRDDAIAAHNRVAEAVKESEAAK